jgi:hypothetical protein
LITRRYFSAAALALALGGCKARTKPAVATDAAPAPGPARSPRLAGAPRVVLEQSARGFGLPSACRLELPIRHAELARGRVRFASTRTSLDELALAVAGETGGGVEEGGIFAFGTQKTRAVVWSELDRPPAFDSGKAGWHAAWAADAEDGERIARIWQEGHGELELGRGDQLELVDLRCQGDRCAALTTLVRRVAAPGATLFVSNPDGKSFTRTDIEPDPAVPWRPHSISDFDGTQATLALASPAVLALFRAGNGAAEKRHELPAPHGVFDVLPGEKPVVIAPGASTEGPCTEDAFPLFALTAGGEKRPIPAQAAPESLIARPLSDGAIVVWIAPVSCRMKTRTVVHAVVLTGDGTATSAPMSVADASGFAVATRGDKLSLWLYTERGISLLSATCKAKGG